jgi:rare lipoprotein A
MPWRFFSPAKKPRTVWACHLTDVTNRETGGTRRLVMVIEERGPYVQGWVIDVSPRTAEKLGMHHDGAAPVEVKPVDQVPNRARDGRAGTD